MPMLTAMVMPNLETSFDCTRIGRIHITPGPASMLGTL